LVVSWRILGVVLRLLLLRDVSELGLVVRWSWALVCKMELLLRRSFRCLHGGGGILLRVVVVGRLVTRVEKELL